MNSPICPSKCEAFFLAGRGIRLDSRSASLRSEAMTSSAGQVFSPRRRDRRIGLSEVLAALSRSISDRADVSLMRGTFEEILRRVVPVRAVRLRDINSRWASGGNDAIESIAIGVPGYSAGGVLEATFD